MGIRVLLVESNADTAAQLVPSLERSGFDVTLARTQRQALSRLGAQPPDVLVVDIASFGRNGYKTSDAVRSRLCEVPTVLLLEQGHAALGAGAEASMTPPFTPRRLLYRLKAIAARLQRQLLQAGSLTFEPDTRTLTKGDVSSRLRPKEAALLALFMRNQGKVLSRHEIIRQVWETEYVGDTRTLSVHVCWLRHRIEDDPKNPVILRTVRGVGYRFEVPPAV